MIGQENFDTVSPCGQDVFVIRNDAHAVVHPGIARWDQA
jgi:hypothetical protein